MSNHDKYTPLQITEWGRMGMNTKLMGVKNKRDVVTMPENLLIITPKGEWYDKRTMDRVEYPAGHPQGFIDNVMDIRQPVVLAAPPKVTPAQKAAKEFFGEQARLEAISLQSENQKSQQLSAPAFGVMPQQKKVVGMLEEIAKTIKGLNGSANGAESRPSVGGVIDMKIQDHGDTYVQPGVNLAT